MSGTSKSTQDTQQQSQTSAWAPTLNTLQGFIGNINDLTKYITPTGAVANAFNQIAQNAGNIPDYSQQALGYASNLIGGGNNFAPMVQDAYGKQAAALNPIMSASLDPTQTPGIADALAATRNDITNSINGQFAAAGRDLSGANSMALGKGLAAGLAPILTNQYNANVGNRMAAAAQLGGAAGSAAGTLSGLQQTGFGNQAQGFDWLMSGLPNAQNAAALNTINAGQMPFQYGAGNLQTLLGLTMPIAGSGGSQSGTSSTQGTQTMSPFQMAMMGINTAANAAKSFGFSDARLKRDIEQIGELFDGTPVYRYRMRGMQRTDIGLLAQDIEKFAPDAVRETSGGYKLVDYHAATERAAAMRAR